MAENNLSSTSLYKKQKRRETRSRVRESLFIHQYVETKYFAIYQEAVELYNNLNQKYPCKPDLRRTDEFRCWKNDIARQHAAPVSTILRQKRRKYNHSPHRNIPMSQCVDTTASLVVLNDAGNQNPLPESPRPETQSSPPLPESLPAEPVHQKIMKLRIPLMSQPPKKPKALQTQVETPAEPVQTPVESNETVIDEVIQQSSDILYPSLTEEISPEIMDKIITELREDPELKDIVVGIEQQIEVEEIGLEIDIPELDDPLQDELENIFW